MARKKEEKTSSVFEIVVVLAIVAIVAATGQVLIHYQGAGNIASSSSGGNLVTGNVIAQGVEEQAQTSKDFVDVGIQAVEVNPPSPILGQPFEIQVTVSNEGFTTIETPFYVQIDVLPNGVDTPITLNTAMTKILAPGDTEVASFNILSVSKEGPMKIIATADSTAKLDDQNPSNNQMSKTVIIPSQ